MNDGSILASLPKFDAHVHLEGSTRRQTLLELALRRGRDLASDLRWGRSPYVDLHGFVDEYHILDDALANDEALERVAEEFCVDASAAGVVYAEVTFTLPPRAHRLGDWHAPLMAAMRGFSRRSAGSVGVALILDLVRTIDISDAERVIEIALHYQGCGVVGVGLSGFEEVPVSRNLRRLIRSAVEDGSLAFFPHAGEGRSSRGIWEVLDIARPTRIGHGIGAVSDRALLSLLSREGIPLEVCISANVATGTAPSVQEHPFRSLLDAGVPVVLGSDDPGAFGVSLLSEYHLIVREFGLSAGELADLTEKAMACSLASDDVRRAFGSALEAWRRTQLAEA